MTHCNIIAMAMKSEPSVERESEQGGREHEFPKVQMVVTIPKKRYGISVRNTSCMLPLATLLNAHFHISRNILSTFHPCIFSSSSFLVYWPVICSRLLFKEYVFHCHFMLSHVLGCLDMPRRRVIVMLAWANRT